jgi:hypothetical protein
MKYLITTIVAVFLFSSCQNHGDPPPPTCGDPCPNVDYSMMNIQSEDGSPIYIKYLNTIDGNYIIPNTPMIGTPLGPGASITLNFRNDNYNHFYFYRNNTFTDEIGKIILVNTQPLYSTICNVKVKISGNYTSDESKLNIANTQNKNICVKSAQFPDWHFWNLSFPTAGSSDQMNGCKTVTLQSSSATNFHHIYFFGCDKCSEASENNNLSKIIYLNTQSAKINLHNIVLR